MLGFYLKSCLQLILSPRHGWEDISYDNPGHKELFVSGFLPFILIVSLSPLIGCIYTGEFEWLYEVGAILKIFLKYFISYFIAGLIFTFYMPVVSQGACKEKQRSVFLMFSLGLLAILDLLHNCLPIDLAVLNFLPLYTLFIMWRGAPYMKVAKGRNASFVFLCFFAVIVAPYLLNLLFSVIMPY